MQHIYLGKALVSGRWISQDATERRRHLYVVGQTGTGKTSFLKTLFVQDVLAGRGATFIDPHGDAARELADSIPSHRLGDVIYFDPSDIEHPLGFNPLSHVPEAFRSMAVSSLLACFQSQWADSWGPRLAYILRHSLTALISAPPEHHHTLLSIQRLLTDKVFRDRIRRHLKDPVCEAFWRDEFDIWDARFRTEAISPILNKIGAYAAHEHVRRIIGQAHSSFQLDAVMNSRRLLIVNLSKGLLGDDGVSLLGSLLVSGLQMAAYQRSTIEEDQRVDHALYIDEFQSFSSAETFKSIFSEARKYRLTLTVSHQFLNQIDPGLLAAVLGNVGTLAAFSVGTLDGARLAEAFKPVNPAELSSGARGRFLLSMRKEGRLHDPIRMISTLEDMSEGSFQKVIALTRRRYGKGKTRREIDARISALYTSAPPKAKLHRPRRRASSR